MNHVQNSNLVAAAIGLAVGVVGAATIFIYQKIMENQNHRTSTNISLEAVNKKVATLQAEIDALRVQQSQLKKKRKAGLRRHVSNDSTYTVTDNDTDIDAFSTAGTDIADDEFYDCSDSESATEDTDIRISEAKTELDLLLTEIDKLMDDDFKIEIYNKLQALAKAQSNNVDIIWRFLRYSYKYSKYTSDVNTKKAAIWEGIAVGEGALSSRDPNLYKWYTILIGVQTDFVSTANRIKGAYKFKEYLTVTLEMTPDDPELYHLLGRLQYELASATWIEKKIAQTVFGEIPHGTYQEALDNFLKTESLKPNLENELYIGKVYIALSMYEEAVKYLQDVVSTPSYKHEDEDIIKEATKLLRKYS